MISYRFVERYTRCARIAVFLCPFVKEINNARAATTCLGPADPTRHNNIACGSNNQGSPVALPHSKKTPAATMWQRLGYCVQTKPLAVTHQRDTLHRAIRVPAVAIKMKNKIAIIPGCL